jgi:hypothetical protein
MGASRERETESVQVVKYLRPDHGIRNKKSRILGKNFHSHLFQAVIQQQEEWRTDRDKVILMAEMWGNTLSLITGFLIPAPLSLSSDTRKIETHLEALMTIVTVTDFAPLLI